jgi:hypothetical protein
LLKEHASSKHRAGPLRQQQESADSVDSSGPSPVAIDADEYKFEVHNYPIVALQLVEHNGSVINESKPV